MYPMKFKQWVTTEMKASSRYSIQSIYTNYDILAKSGQLEDAYQKWVKASSVINQYHRECDGPRRMFE